MTIALDATIALISRDDFLILSEDDPTNENINFQRIDFLINVASIAIESYCCRKFIKPSAAIVESFSGNGMTDYYVKNMRIATGTTPTIQYRITDTWYSIDTGVYPISHDNDSGRIWFTEANNTFWRNGQDNWRVTHYYGWTYNDLPDDLKMVCAQLVIRQRLLLDGKEGMDSISFGDSSTSFNLSRLPENLRSVLDRYKRFVA